MDFFWVGLVLLAFLVLYLREGPLLFGTGKVRFRQSYMPAGGQLLQRFESLSSQQDMRGMQQAEIVKHVGPPNAVLPAQNGLSLLHWEQGSVRVGLLFRDQICEGFSYIVDDRIAAV